MAQQRRRTTRLVVEPPPRPLASLVTPLGLMAIGMALYVPGLQWGLPATVSWSQDTVAGLRTIGPLEQWPNAWRGRYPPGHYMLLRAAYQPILARWDATGERFVDPATGQKQLKPPHDKKLGRLFLVARLVSVAMALATVLGIWFAARQLIRDEVATAIATIAFMSGAGFAYFARLGNVDVPSICWLSWSLLFYGRALRSRSTLDAAMLGLFASLAISTKDSVAGIYPGMAIVLLWHEIKFFRARQLPGSHVVRAILQPRWLVGIALFVLPYLLVNGAFTNWDGYLLRMKYWIDPPPTSLHARQYHQPSQLHLLWASLRCAATATGWTMVVGYAAAVFYVLKRHRPLALLVLPPVLTYYFIVIVPTGFVYERFLLPVFAVLCLPAGLVAAAVLRMRRLRPLARIAIVAAPLLPSLAYTTALNVEMMNDSRYEAEDWILEHLSTKTGMGALVNDLDRPFRPQYLPRVHDFGYTTFPVVARVETFQTPQPEVLLLSQYDYEDFAEPQRACVEHLFAGQLGYEVVTQFKAKYLGTGRSWLAVAGWLAPTPGKISPTITIFRKIERPSLDDPSRQFSTGARFGYDPRGMSAICQDNPIDGQDNLVLASASPRRAAILRDLGWSFRIVPPPSDDPSTLPPHLGPADRAKALSAAKARAVAERLERGLILAGDTLAAKGNETFGKPSSRRHAERILQAISATSHHVITALTLLDARSGRVMTRHDTSIVVMHKLTQEEINLYLNTNAWIGKAGAYGIQDRADAFVERIEGSFTNVVGLPVELFGRMLADWEAPPPLAAPPHSNDS